MPAELRPFVITVLAGVNGAGKSSVGGAHLQQTGGEFYNPDLAARTAREASPTLTAEAANAFAWREGKTRLESAIANRTDFNFETTLGGETLTKLLIEAARKGATLNLWFAGLASVELHFKRVAARVEKGGHAIPETDIRKRWIGSQVNLVKLLPYVTNLRVYDNSAEKEPNKGHAPEPKLILSVTNRAIEFPGPDEVKDTPDWAKPIVVAAFRAILRQIVDPR
ncbi:MAG: ZTL protein [Opitutus sp.]|nr:ZTL protein [Opitutus sp.]